MSGMRNAAALHRMAWAALIALLLGLRVVGSGGYMPALDHGRLALIVCPDGEWTEPAVRMPAMDRHHGPAHHEHQQCPYAAAAAIAFAAGSAPLLPVPSLMLVLLAAFALPSLVARARVRRPNQTGPPISA